MRKILLWLFFAKIRMATCIPEVNKSGFVRGKENFNITKIGHLPAQLNESSGLARVFKRNTFWTNNDGGGKPEIYEIDTLGNLLTTLPITNSNNIDWEDLAQDDKGNIFIGDFGNNSNTRKDLKIYKFHSDQPDKIEEISFNFADQQDFPPSKKDRNFDCEAFFWANDSLYLFSKNRGKKFVKMYVLPSIAGSYILKPKENIFLKSNITSADISPDKKQFALLSYGKLFFFGIENDHITFSKPQFCIKTAMKQAEALIYAEDHKLLITNEQGDIWKVIF